VRGTNVSVTDFRIEIKNQWSKIDY
jgi:hypothetical protein